MYTGAVYRCTPRVSLGQKRGNLCNCVLRLHEHPLNRNIEEAQPLSTLLY